MGSTQENTGQKEEDRGAPAATCAPHSTSQRTQWPSQCYIFLVLDHSYIFLSCSRVRVSSCKMPFVETEAICRSEYVRNDHPVRRAQVDLVSGRGLESVHAWGSCSSARLVCRVGSEVLLLIVSRLPSPTALLPVRCRGVAHELGDQDPARTSTRGVPCAHRVSQPHLPGRCCVHAAFVRCVHEGRTSSVRAFP